MTREPRVIHINAEDSLWTVNSPVKSVADSCSSGSSSAQSSSCDSTTETDSSSEASTESSAEPAPEPWTRADIVQLFSLAKTGKKPWAFADALGRSTSAVQHAMRKMIIQQLIFHNAEDVAATYHMDIYDLHRILAPRKYYVPITQKPAPATAPATVPVPSSHVVPVTRSYPSWCIWACIFMALPIIAMQPFVADFKP
jgi:hypothetical protein